MANPKNMEEQKRPSELTEEVKELISIFYRDAFLENYLSPRDYKIALGKFMAKHGYILDMMNKKALKNFQENRIKSELRRWATEKNPRPRG